jgi:hypothetical protein
MIFHEAPENSRVFNDVYLLLAASSEKHSRHAKVLYRTSLFSRALQGLKSETFTSNQKTLQTIFLWFFKS